jgi:hypothetical protein
MIKIGCGLDCASKVEAKTIADLRRIPALICDKDYPQHSPSLFLNTLLYEL